MIVPFSPGGTSDTLARILGQKMTEHWGQQIVVDFRPAASGIIGTEITMRAAMPIVAESGLPGYALVNWWGLFAPRGVPQPIINKLHAELVRAHALPDLKVRYGNLGVEATSSTPEQFTDYIKSEAARFSKVLRDAGAKVN